MTLSYAGFYIVPTQPEHKIRIQDKYLFSSVNKSETCNDIQVVFFVNPHIIILNIKIVTCSSIPKKRSAIITDQLNVPVKLIRLQDT